MRENLLDIFSARDLPVDDGARARIAACHDPEILRRWHRAAITAASVRDVLGD